MGLIHGCDTVTVPDIPTFMNTSHDAVAYYVDGLYSDEAQVIAHDPRAHHLSITVTAGEVADCLDIENGDATPAQAPGWWHDATLHGIWRPCLYASLDLMPTVVAELSRAGIHRTSYRLWVAHYDNVAEVPQGYDGKQYTGHYMGRNLDGDVFLESFFPQVRHRPQLRRDRTDRATVSLDPRTGRWDVTPAPPGHVPAR